MRGHIKLKRPAAHGRPSVWRIVVTTGYEVDPATGRMKQRRHWETFHGKSEAAEARLNALLGHVQNGSYIDPATTTCIEWFREWLSTSVKPTLRPSTYVSYEGIVRNHIAKSTLAGIPLQKLRQSHIEHYYATAGLSAAAKRNHHAVIHRALRKAVKEKLILANPASDLDHAPKRPRGRDKDARVNCWTARDARTFLETAKKQGPQVAALFAFALDSGCRKAEICGLRWSDVDLDAGQVRIAQQLWKPGPEPSFGPTKNGEPRDVTLAAETVALLRVHKKHQAALKMRNRTSYKDFGLVFAKEWGDLTNRRDMIGLPIQANHFGERLFGPLVKAAGVKRITPHGMRHTCATLLLLAGEAVHVVAKRLGHSDVQITWGTYAHALPDVQKAAARTIGGLLYGRN
jgi:integrase